MDKIIIVNTGAALSAAVAKCLAEKGVHVVTPNDVPSFMLTAKPDLNIDTVSIAIKDVGRGSSAPGSSLRQDRRLFEQRQKTMLRRCR